MKESDCHADSSVSIQERREEVAVDYQVFHLEKKSQKSPSTNKHNFLTA